MNRKPERQIIAGPVGAIECVVELPAGPARGVAVVCHPHPVHGGTMDNKVAQTLARAFVQVGYRAVRFNFRGVGESAGAWDEGHGEIDDALAVIKAFRDPQLPLALAGFSFGGYVASRAALALAATAPVDRVALIGPATATFDVAPVPAGSLIIHGETDDVVALQSTLDWARPQGLPVVVIPGVGHFFHGQLPLLKSLVVGAWHR
jgi:alpha/beta superfamily hydrolase